MKKKIAIWLCMIGLAVTLTSCNYDVVDTTYKYDRAIISLPNGEIVEGEVEKWSDYENCDQVQVKINGVTYYCHSSDVVLIKEAD